MTYTSESHESASRPSAREELERFLENEPLGSPKWLRAADEFALLHVRTRIDQLTEQTMDEAAYLTSLPMQQAVAQEAQISETMRNRRVGPDAIAYRQADVRGLYYSYYQENVVPDPKVEGQHLILETNVVAAEAALNDLSSIIASRI